MCLGVDSFSILFNHHSVQKPAVSPGVLMVFRKEGSLERMGKCPLECGSRSGAPRRHEPLRGEVAAGAGRQNGGGEGVGRGDGSASLAGQPAKSVRFLSCFCV